MEEERIIRVSDKHRKYTIIAIVVFLLAICLFVILTKPASKELFEHVRYLYEIGGGWLLLYMGALFLFFLIFMVFEHRYYRLIFTDKDFTIKWLQTRRAPHPQIKYSNVTRVVRSVFGQIRVDTSDGKSYPINIRRLEGGSKGLLEELKKHIPEQRFEKELEESVKKFTEPEKIVIGVLALGMLIVFVDMFYKDIYEGIKSDVAWTLEIEGSWEEQLEDFVLSENGDIWVLVRAYPGEWDDPESYEVRKYSGGEVEAMRLPSFDELFPEGKPERWLTSPRAIFLGEKELPELEFFPDVRRLLWNGHSWEWGTDTVEEGDDKGITDYLAKRTGDDYWNKLESDRIISVKNPETGKVEEVALDGRDDYYWLRWYEDAQYGRTIVSLDGPGERKFLQSFKGNEDEKDWLELQRPSLSSERHAWIQDYTADSAGNIYVLVREQESCIDGVETSHVGKLSKINGTWEWRTVNHPDKCIFGSQHQVLIDTRGRIWLPATTSVAVVDPIIFDKADVLEEDLIIYTEDNSGYFIGHDITVGPDGRYWLLDISGHGLVWIDPNVDEIEGPIPPWIAELINSSSFSWGMTIASTGIFIVAMVFLISIIRKRTAPSKKMEI